MNSNAVRVYSVQSAPDRGCTVTTEHREQVGSVAGQPQFDVVIAGGGVLGAAVAARLSRTSARVALVEAETDLAVQGVSGGQGGGVRAGSQPGHGRQRIEGSVAVAGVQPG